MELHDILLDVEQHKISVSDAESKILSLLDENEVGVSDSSDKHGVSPHVRKRNASGETDTSSDESEQITLGNRIDTERECDHDPIQDEKYRIVCSKCDKLLY